MAFEHDMRLDTSDLSEVLSIVNQLRDTAQDLNQQKTKLKVDSTDVEKAKKEYDGLINDIKNTDRTKAEIFDSKAVQSTINKITKQMDTLYSKLQNSDKNLTPIQTKSFIEGFKTLELYSNQFGKNLTNKYQEIYNTITSAIDKMGTSVSPIVKRANVDVTELTSIIDQAVKDANTTLQYDLYDGAIQSTNKLLKNAKESYTEEVNIAKQSAQQQSNIEKNKYEEMLNLVDQFKKGLTDKFASINEGEVFQLDLDKFAVLQKQVYDIFQTLSGLGVDTTDIETAFGNIQNKVYIPTEQIDAARSSIKSSQAEIDSLRESIAELQMQLNRSVDLSDYEQLEGKLEETTALLRETINTSQYWRELAGSGVYTESEYGDLAARAYEYKTALEEITAQFEELKRKYEELKNIQTGTQGEGGGGLKLKSSTEGVAIQVSEVADETERATKDTQKYGETASSSFNSSKLQGYVTILDEIRNLLKDISTALGKVDDSNGFTNIVSSIDILLNKLNEMYQMIGTGIITVNKGGQSTANTIISSERDRLMRTYTRVVNSSGGEEKLFNTMGQTLNSSYGTKPEEYYNLFSKNAITSILDPSDQINRLRDFFNQYKNFQTAIDENIISLENYISTLEKEAENQTKDNISKINQTQSNSGKYSMKAKESSFSKDENKRSIIRAKQELQAYTDLSKQTKNIRIPSDYNDNLNKKITEATQQELDSEESKINLITEKLSEIKELLSEISQKNLFGDSLTKFESQLDAIVKKFDSLVADVQIINQSPLTISSEQTDVSATTTTTQASIGEITQAENEMGNVGQSATKKIQEGLSSTETQAERLVHAFEQLTSFDGGKLLDLEIEQVVNELIGGLKTSKETAGELRTEIKNVMTEIQSGGSANSKGILDILGADEKYLKQYFSDILYQYNQVRDYVSKSKIQYLPDDVSEFGNDWNKIRGTIGTKVMTSTGGTDATVFLRELNEQFHITDEEALTTQEAIQILYDYLSNPPDVKQLFSNIIDSSNGEEVKYYNDKLTEIVNTINQRKALYAQDIQSYDEYLKQLEHKIAEEKTAYSKRKETIVEESDVNTGGVNSTIDNLRQTLVDIIGDIEQIQRTKLKPQVDDSEIKKLVSDFQNKYNFIPPEIMDDAAWDTIIRNTDYIGKNLSSINNVDVSWFRELISNNGLFDTSKVEKYVQEYNTAQSLINKHVTTIANSSAATEQLAEVENQEAQAAQAAAENEKMLAKAREEVTQSSTQLPAVIPLVDNQAKATEAFYKDIAKYQQNIFSDSGAAQSGKMIKYEAKELATLQENAEGAAKSKNKFAVANGAVLASIVKSLAGISSEGNALKSIISVIQSFNGTSNNDITTSVDQQKSKVQQAIELTNELYNNQIKLSNIKPGTNVDIYNNLVEKITNAKQAIEALGLSQEEQAQVAERTKDAQVKAINAINEAERKQQAETEKTNKKLQDSIQQAEKLQATVRKQATSMMNNGKLMSVYSDQVTDILAKIDSINTSVNPTEAINQLKKLQNELVKISSAAEQAGKSGKTLGQMFSTRFKSLISYLGTFTSFYRVISYIRSAFSTLKDLDTQLVDLRKTTTMTSSELNEFYNASSNVAKQMGVTTSEIISQASAWSRLGYSSKEASTEMAKLSSQFTSISPGMTTDNSTDYLVSTMQANIHA